MTHRVGSLAAHAREYAERGWPIFPCRPRGKAPITESGFHDATTDRAMVGAWWSQTPDANIGFVPGRAGILVVDIDGPEGEAEAQRLGLLAEPTMEVTTGRGQHLYFEHPGGHMGNRKLGDSLDVRADAGYVLLPPSIHPTGAIYEARGNPGWIKALPPAAVKALREPRGPRLPPRGRTPIDAGTPRRRAYVAAAIEDEALKLANTPEGGRNNALNKAAFSLARFVETGEADPGKLVEVLTTAARHCGLPDFEIERTIQSAFGAWGVGV